MRETSAEDSRTERPLEERDPRDLILDRRTEWLRRALGEDYRTNGSAASAPPPDPNGRTYPHLGPGTFLPGYQAHHIIPIGVQNETIRRLRARFDRWKIDLDSVANGIYLPNSAGVANPEGRTFHSHTQRQAYFGYIERVFVDVTTREEALDKLEQVKQELMDGLPDLPRKDGTYAPPIELLDRPRPTLETSGHRLESGI